jgi:hypothetical protein
LQEFASGRDLADFFTRGNAVLRPKKSKFVLKVISGLRASLVARLQIVGVCSISERPVLTEEEPTNEIVPERQSSDTSAFDDIYVPGIGVRGALGDDGPESFQCWSSIREGCSRGAAFVSRSTIQTFGNVRRTRSRLAVKLTRIGIEIQTVIGHRRKFLVHLRNCAGRDLRKTQKRLTNTGQNTVRNLRSASNNKLSLSQPVTECVARVLQGTRFRLLRVAETTKAQIHGASKYRLSLPPIPVTVLRNSHRTHSLLVTIMVGARNRLRAAAHYNPRLWISANYKLDLTRLRRAASALAVLLVMLVFVIQEIVMVVKH